METIERDIIVVGAGPCGATAAYFLAKPEKDFPAKSVAFLDKATFPRDKYCGDAWCSPALDILEEMHVLQKLEAQGLIQDCTSGGFVSPSGESFISTGEDPSMESGVRCYAIKRIICDEAIVRRAQEVGAELFENADCEKAELIDGLWKVTCRDGRIFKAKVLIAADGAASQLSRSLGIVEGAPDAMASRQYIKGGTHNFKSGGVLFYPDYAIPGYVALFRHYNDDIDVGVYLLENGATKPEDILKVSIEEVARDPFMQRIIGPNAVALERPRVASIRTGGVKKSFDVQFMAVGDAAGQTDPLTGEGIHTGMIGSKIAAQTIHEMFAKNDFSENYASLYHKRWVANFGKDFPVSKIAAKMTYNIPLFLDAANVVAQRKGDAFMADFGAAMTGVKPKSIFLRPGMSVPLTLEVVRQFFIQKVLRPYKNIRHAYDMRSIEKSERATAFDNSCILDNSMPLGLLKLESSKNSALDDMFRFESTDTKARKVLVMYASEYGFVEEVALDFCETLFKASKDAESGARQALSVRYVNAKHFELIDWQEVDTALFICSTAGDGDAPQSAKAFFQFLETQKPDLLRCDISVLAMGDSAYPNYCAAGVELEELLKKCTANVLVELQKVNSEDTKPIALWSESIQKLLLTKKYWQQHPSRNAEAGEQDGLRERAQAYFAKQSNEPMQATVQQPLVAKLLSQQLITNIEAGGRETYHVRLDLTVSNSHCAPLKWQAGDALAVLPCNPQAELEAVFALLSSSSSLPVSSTCNPDTTIELPQKRGSATLHTALSDHLDIKLLPPRFFDYLTKLADENNQIEEKSSLQKIIADKNKHYELQDVLALLPNTCKYIQAQNLVDVLSKLAPRYYSIASDYSEGATSIDLCVASENFIEDGLSRVGVASHFLNKALSEGQSIKVAVHANSDFRLPKADSKAACVMIGAGTGLAPYRAFLQALEKNNSASINQTKKHLVFFGCRHENADYLYKEELQAWKSQGLIDIFPAFSRDEAEKVYVQDKLRENAALIWSYLESGDHFYICGDATHMAGDVEVALLAIIQEQGALSESAAKDYLKALSKVGRYQKDVWI